MYGCPCCDWESVQAFESRRAHGCRFGPPPWARFWMRGYGPTQAEQKEHLEALKKHLEEELAEVTKELSTL